MARKKARTATITSVTFRANIPVDGRYNHIHVEATASVAPGENPQAVLDEVKDFVATELKRAKEGERPVPVVATGRFRIP